MTAEIRPKPTWQNSIVRIANHPLNDLDERKAAISVSSLVSACLEGVFPRSKINFETPAVSWLAMGLII